MIMALSSPLAAAACGPDTQADFRQLRHQTKNALMRILAQVSSVLPASDPAQRVAAELERRILLTAAISDALFGLTRAPGRLEDRLQSLCSSIVDLASESDQHLTLRSVVHGAVPPAQAEVVLRVAHELVGNAVKHGMHMRLVGAIEVTVSAGPDATRLDVVDDGWGCGTEPRPGEGMQVATILAAKHGGSVTLRRCRDRTVATLVLPPQQREAEQHAG